MSYLGVPSAPKAPRISSKMTVIIVCNKQDNTNKKFEIIKNIKKQEGEINKIVGDTRTVQREIQSAQELLERTYTVVEETLFREARSDDLCRQAYKHLHGMHSGFADLLVKVEATGAARRAQTDIQRKLTALSKQPNNSERVARDLSLIQEQIVELEAKLSSAA